MRTVIIYKAHKCLLHDFLSLPDSGHRLLREGGRGEARKQKRFGFSFRFRFRFRYSVRLTWQMRWGRWNYDMLPQQLGGKRWREMGDGRWKGADDSTWACQLQQRPNQTVLSEGRVPPKFALELVALNIKCVYLAFGIWHLAFGIWCELQLPIKYLGHDIELSRQQHLNPLQVLIKY